MITVSAAIRYSFHDGVFWGVGSMDKIVLAVLEKTGAILPNNFFLNSVNSLDPSICYLSANKPRLYAIAAEASSVAAPPIIAPRANALVSAAAKSLDVHTGERPILPRRI